MDLVDKSVVTVQRGIDIWLRRRPISPSKPACTRVLGTLGTLRTAAGNVQPRVLTSASLCTFAPTTVLGPVSQVQQVPSSPALRARSILRENWPPTCLRPECSQSFNPFKRLLLAIPLALVVVGCGGAQEGTQTRSAKDTTEPEPESEIVIPDDPHLLLPSSCFGAISIDLAALRSSSVFRNYTKKIAADLNQSERRVANYIIEKADRLVVGLALRSKESQKKPYSVVIGRGDFNTHQLLDIINKLAAADAAKGLKPIASSKPQEGRFSVFLDDGEIQGVILDSRTIMIADNKLIPDVLELLTDRDAPRFVNSEIYKRITPHIALGQGGLSMIAATPEPMKKRVLGRKKSNSIFAKYESALESIQAGGVRLDLNRDVDVEVVAETASRDHPQTIVNMINGLIFIGRIAIDDPVFNALANQLSTRVNGLFVQLKLHATEQQVSHLIETAKKRAN